MTSLACLAGPFASRIGYILLRMGAGGRCPAGWATVDHDTRWTHPHGTVDFAILTEEGGREDADDHNNDADDHDDTGDYKWQRWSRCSAFPPGGFGRGAPVGVIHE